MYNILRNQRGNIAIALALAVVGIMSGITMATLAYKDTIDARYDFDGIQELHLLRAETKRAQVVAQLLDYSGNGFTLPNRFATIISSHAKNIFKMQTKMEKGNISTGGGLYFTQGYTIKSLVKANRGAGSTSLFGNNLSLVAKYGEKTIRRNSFAGYHYFTDTDQSMNDTNVYFWGPDVIHGKVHSNSDIWLKQAGGGTNGGWPTFYGPVYTAGTFRTLSGAIPYLQVFRDSYWENVSPLEFNPTATTIRQNGNVVGPNSYDENRIIFVTVIGGGFSSMLGQVVIASEDTADVWTSYPPRTAPYLFGNTWPKRDTLWTIGPGGGSAGGSNIVHSKLWIRGTFSGAQTWCSVDTMYLNDNIILSGTPMGQAPDGSASGSLTNLNDFVGLVSEKSIVIQYGFRDPQDSTRYKPNCDGNGTGAIWIYAAMCALGDGQGIPQKDGIFTFEYQHPHPSVPAVRLGTNDYVWDKIDLHRRRYPPLTPTSWPGNIDLPYYNPLWPEGYPYTERGTIHLWGSVAQRRRGYVHRNLSDSEYPNPTFIWNIPLDLAGGPAGNTYIDPVLGIAWRAQNAPNVTGGGVGYATKDYHFDNRFSSVTPPDFPEVHVRGGLTPFESEAWSLKKPPQTF